MTNSYPCLVTILFLTYLPDVVNGRAFDNYSGKETSFQYNRKNVVDYCFISNSFAWSVLYFNVTEHLPIFLVS